MKSLNENIVRILSFYKQLSPLQLWYEINATNNGGGRVSISEIKKTLVYLQKQGVVKRINSEKDFWALNLSGTSCSGL
jgi:hypothetical protein